MARSNIRDDQQTTWPNGYIIGNNNREELIFLAKTAEQAERYLDLKKIMKHVTTLGEPLNLEERNLLSVAYKNVVGTLRSQWRIICAIEDKESTKHSTAGVLQTSSSEQVFKNAKPDHSETIMDMRKRIVNEVETICNEVIQLLDMYCLELASEPEARIFFIKMKGDYYRYLAEIGGGSNDAKEKSIECYDQARDIMNSELSPTNPIRLGMALSWATFSHDILQEPERAIKIAKEAFDSALADLDTLNEESYKDSTLIMQLLRDNLTLWTQDS